jgi:hypothetical protein
MGVARLVDTVRVEVPEPPGGMVTCVAERVSVGPPETLGKTLAVRVTVPLKLCWLETTTVVEFEKP